MYVFNRNAYAVLAAPLAMAALPVYVYIPKLYGDEFGLGLALTSVMLLLSRVVDTFQDPWLGRLTDYLHPRKYGWKWLIVVAALCLGLSFFALFNPPPLNQAGLILWLGVCLVITLPLIVPSISPIWPQVEFDDWMYLMEEGVLMNRSVMKKFGFRLGEVILFFRKTS